MGLDGFAAMLPSFVEAGFLLGCFPLLFGLGVHAVIHIFKNI